MSRLHLAICSLRRTAPAGGRERFAVMESGSSQGWRHFSSSRELSTETRRNSRGASLPQTAARPDGGPGKSRRAIARAAFCIAWIRRGGEFLLLRWGHGAIAGGMQPRCADAWQCSADAGGTGTMLIPSGLTPVSCPDPPEHLRGVAGRRGLAGFLISSHI